MPNYPRSCAFLLPDLALFLSDQAVRYQPSTLREPTELDAMDNRVKKEGLWRGPSRPIAETMLEFYRYSHQQ